MAAYAWVVESTEDPECVDGKIEKSPEGSTVIVSHA